MLALSISQRGQKETPEKLRARGLVPAVFYGPKEPSTAISIDTRDLERAFKTAGETTIITLKGVGEDKDTLIRDAQFHPVTGTLLHVDFYVLEKGKKIELDIPLEFSGVAPAEKAGHIVVKSLHEVKIEVEPQEIPQHLTIDLSKLVNVGDRILAGDIALPPSATLITDADEIAASVTEFKEESAEIRPAPVTEILTAKPAAEGESTAEKSKKE